MSERLQNGADEVIASNFRYLNDLDAKFDGATEGFGVSGEIFEANRVKLDVAQTSVVVGGSLRPENRSTTPVPSASVNTEPRYTYFLRE